MILNYQDLYKEILKVDFILPGSNTRIKFDNNGELRYRTYIYRMVDLIKLSANGGDLSEYVLIGSWSGRIYINGDQRDSQNHFAVKFANVDIIK